VSPCCPSMSECRPLQRVRLLLHALQFATTTLVVKPSLTLPPPRSGHRRHDQAATLLGPPPPSMVLMTTTTSTSASLASKGYHMHVVLVGFYSSHNIRTITMLQLWGMSARRIPPSAYSPVSPSRCSCCDCGGC
jgi:hypothetical protein